MLVFEIIGVECEKVEIVCEGKCCVIYIGCKIQGEIELMEGVDFDYLVMILNFKYWMGLDIIVVKGFKFCVCDFGCVWDFGGKFVEVCLIDWFGLK